ncbi:AraC family transcriptional regulator [Variovorax sp. YR216]|uniref:AraC family transcriptional regulator n=1 Tax=Variovorax sp. YR216 TaxID=1882828 RepID=UPI000894E9BC|nr:AraC family transcriptional regulator [Variovorax sp. YR216]SEA21890.1 transcriptional regulator, AraC family [Variovorax sp. YR216]
MRRVDILELRDDRSQAAGHLTRGATLTGYEALARTVGLDPVRMMKAAGLPIATLADKDTLVSVDSVATLLEESARESGQEAFGLLLAETRRFSNLGVLAAVLREEPTLRAALESLARYQCMQNGGLRISMDDMGQFTMVFLALRLHNHGASRQGIEMAAGITLRTLRALTHDDFDPVGFCFHHGRPQNLEVHRRVLGAPIDFSHPFNAIVCRSRDLDKTIPAADPELGHALKRWLDQQLAESKDEPLDRVRQVARMLIPSGTCSVERVAERLGTHRRTLNRQLAVVGESVSTVIEGVRGEMAQSYLTGGVRTCYEVGHLLGFASGAEFSRWFRGHFGMTASEWMAVRGLGRGHDTPDHASHDASDLAGYAK